MPVLETNRVVPKSVLRHRPISSETETLSVPTWSISTPRASRPVQPKRETRTRSRPEPSAGKKRLPVHTSPQTWHWMVPVGLTMTGMVLLALVLQLAWSWGTKIYNDLHYGMPRTTQVDAYVGHETGKTLSHFIAENLRGRVLIIELPGGDAQHARIFVGPQISGADADQDPVTLSFVDRNGNHHPDMLVQFGSMEIWYANEHGTFVPQ